MDGKGFEASGKGIQEPRARGSQALSTCSVRGKRREGGGVSRARSCRPSLRGSDSPWRHRAFNLCPCLLGRKLLRSMDFDIFLCLAACPLARGRPSRDMHGMRK